MKSSLVFPDGVSLATRDDLPGPAGARDTDWVRLEAASIAPGYVIEAAKDPRFTFYAEANIHAPDVWQAFVRLSNALLGEWGILLLAFKDDDEPQALGEAAVSRILSCLELHADQLAHDGYAQFGIVTQDETTLSEVFVSSTKHFKVWFNDENAFRAVMNDLGLKQADKLQFIDEYPRVTRRLPKDRALNIDDLAEVLVAALRDDLPS